MTPALLDEPAPETAAPPEQTPACAACPHPLDEHDAIAMRFCRATASAGHDRGCVCRS
jgi:hypothetical protein